MVNDEYILDTETCGLHGTVVLIQYALGDGEINLFSPWENCCSESINLIEKFANHPAGVVGFNLAFDWFHLYKWWTMMKMLEEIEGPDAYPEEHIDLLVELEDQARDYPDCLKPVTALDLFLHARKGPYQSTMDRKNVKLKKVPAKLAWPIAKELEARIPLKDIYFARRKDKLADKWQIVDRLDTFGLVDPNWKDIVVRFKPSSALKALAVDALGVDPYEVLKYADISPKMYPTEFGYAPFAKAAMFIRLKNKSKQKKRELWKYKHTWPDVIKNHIVHWGHHEGAREYAKNDIVYTRALRLHKDFINAEVGDDDSILACMVGCNRWRGYSLDIEGVKLLKEKARLRKYLDIDKKVLLPTAPNDVKRYIMDVCDETEKLAILIDKDSGKQNTTKITLEKLAKEWTIECPVCSTPEWDHDIHCTNCKGKGVVPHEAAKRASQILSARKGTKRIELCDKLLAAGRLHASMKVIGSKSGRMSGTDGLNALGLDKTAEVKSTFLFRWGNEILGGGDFDAFEVTIAVAIYGDSELQKDLLTCELCKSAMIFNQKHIEYVCTNPECGSTKGQKIHALFGTCVFPPMTYEEIKATEGTEEDKYTRSKSAVFTLIYFGGPYSLAKKLGVDFSAGEEGERQFKRKYKGVGRAQERIKNQFGSMRQPGGRGTKVEWHDPAEKAETLFGFPRYFTLENTICKTLFNLANNMPPNIKASLDARMRVIRTDRQQTAGGAACSAIYSAAFNLQGYNVRAAGNHEVQGSGAQITKRVQRRIWDIQPVGVHKWLVQPMNIHDSVMTPMKPEVVSRVAEVVRDTVEEFRPKVPLIKLGWESHLSSWADKKGPVCQVDQNNVIIKAYKRRGKDEQKIAMLLSTRGSGWRFMTKDEIKATVEWSKL